MLNLMVRISKCPYRDESTSSWKDTSLLGFLFQWWCCCFHRSPMTVKICCWKKKICCWCVSFSPPSCCSRRDGSLVDYCILLGSSSFPWHWIFFYNLNGYIAFQQLEYILFHVIFSNIFGNLGSSFSSCNKYSYNQMSGYILLLLISH